MTSLSDTLTVGLVLVLLFGAVALYLYTRIQQAEQKISLLESILLDLKMSLEIKSFSEIPALDYEPLPKGIASTEQNETTEETYTPFEDDQMEVIEEVEQPTVTATSQEETSQVVETQEVEQYKSVVADAVKENIQISATTSPYDTMTLKELQALAKTRGISGAGTMKKGPIIEALKTSDKSQPSPMETGLNGSTTSFLDTSAAFPSSESS